MADGLNPIDSIGLATEKLEDARYLVDEIKTSFFEVFDPDKDVQIIAWEYTRYAALFRILEISLDDVYAVLKNTELKKKDR